MGIIGIILIWICHYFKKTKRRTLKAFNFLESCSTDTERLLLALLIQKNLSVTPDWAHVSHPQSNLTFLLRSVYLKTWRWSVKLQICWLWSWHWASGGFGASCSTLLCLASLVRCGCCHSDPRCMFAISVYLLLSNDFDHHRSRSVLNQWRKGKEMSRKPQSQAAPSSWGTPPTSSAPESEKASAIWRSTKWYKMTRLM